MFNPDTVAKMGEDCPMIKEAGYEGVVFDVEVTRGGMLLVDSLEEAFKKCKAADLVVMVTTSHRLPGNWTCKPRFPRSTPDTSVTFLPDTMTTDSPTPLLSTTRPFRTVTKDARVSPSPGRTSRRNLGYGAKPSTYTPTRPPSFRQTFPS